MRAPSKHASRRSHTRARTAPGVAWCGRKRAQGQRAQAQRAWTLRAYARHRGARGCRSVQRTHTRARAPADGGIPADRAGRLQREEEVRPAVREGLLHPRKAR
eukprot:3504719-Prymnesium_polylepis.3